jgi:hypothetical protein
MEGKVKYRANPLAQGPISPPSERSTAGQHNFQHLAAICGNIRCAGWVYRTALLTGKEQEKSAMLK